jgi:iron complex outermembrane recepter protein
MPNRHEIAIAIASVLHSRSARLMLAGASLVACLNLGSASVAIADASAADSSTSADTLGEIMVTAQRRSERLDDVPIAVTAVSSDELARAHIDDVSRLQFVTPGLTWGQQGSDSFPAIRGARTSLVSAQNDPIIAFYLDGIYQSRTQQQSIPLFDVARVEVERGPQGTLYGRNTFGGNFSIVTNEPTNTFSAGATLEAGNFAHDKVDAYLNLPINASCNCDLRACMTPTAAMCIQSPRPTSTSMT